MKLLAKVGGYGIEDNDASERGMRGGKQMERSLHAVAGSLCYLHFFVFLIVSSSFLFFFLLVVAYGISYVIRRIRDA